MTSTLLLLKGYVSSFKFYSYIFFFSKSNVPFLYVLSQEHQKMKQRYAAAAAPRGTATIGITQKRIKCPNDTNMNKVQHSIGKKCLIDPFLKNVHF